MGSFLQTGFDSIRFAAPVSAIKAGDLISKAQNVMGPFYFIVDFCKFRIG